MTAPDSEGRQTGFQGNGYYVYGSNANTGINRVVEAEILEFEIDVPEALVGATLRFRIRSSRDGLAASDQQNDIWLGVQHADGSGSIKEFLVGNGLNEPLPVSGDFIKVFGGPNNGTWGYASSVDGAPGNFPTQIQFPASGRYVLQVAGRSQGFHADWIELYTGGAPSPDASDSTFVTDGPQPVVLVNAIPDQVFADGVTDSFNLPAGTFDDPNDDPITYQVAVTAANGSDVSGVTINGTTGQITGLSTLAIDTYTVLVTAQTVDGIASDTFEIGIVDEIALETLRIAVSSASDDFEERGGGSSSDLEFGLNGSSPQEIGIRFNGVTIPAGAVITDAYIELTADGSNAAPANFTIGIQDSENAATFISTADLLGRQTAGDLVWSNVEPWTVGQTYRTPNLATLIQPVIGTDGVTDGALAFLMNGSGARAAESFGNGTPPNLVVEFGPMEPTVSTVSITADANGDEAGEVPGQFTVSLSEVALNETVVTYSVGGTATPGPGADYQSLPGSLVIPAGQQSATLVVPVQQDSVVEGNESVDVTLTGVTGSDAVLGTTTTATVFIADDDALPLSSLILEAETADVITNYRNENIGVASGGVALSFLGRASNESGSAAFVFGDAPDELTGIYDIAIGTFDESDGVASFTVDLTDFETGITTEIGSWELNASLGSSGATQATLIMPFVAGNVGLTAGDIITVNGFENEFEHARLDYLRLVPSM
ncbi:MAG: Calx-beta domain-containing protein [Cyanobacteria bacterium J06638_6]